MGQVKRKGGDGPNKVKRIKATGPSKEEEEVIQKLVQDFYAIEVAIAPPPGFRHEPKEASAAAGMSWFDWSSPEKHVLLVKPHSGDPTHTLFFMNLPATPITTASHLQHLLSPILDGALSGYEVVAEAIQLAHTKAHVTFRTKPDQTFSSLADDDAAVDPVRVFLQHLQRAPERTCQLVWRPLEEEEDERQDLGWTSWLRSYEETFPSLQHLKEAADLFMQRFDAAEALKERAMAKKAAVADEDGFTLVTRQKTKKAAKAVKKEAKTLT